MRDDRSAATGGATSCVAILGMALFVLIVSWVWVYLILALVP